MSYRLQDFFRVDVAASNLCLKKLLDEEGLSLGYRGASVLREAAQGNLLFSYAFLEAWSKEEFSSSDVRTLLLPTTNLDRVCQERGWSCEWVPEGLTLIALRDEAITHLGLELSQPPISSGLGAMVGNVQSPSTMYGKTPSTDLCWASVWDTAELERLSVSLLDGESEAKLLEAFRYLYRAALGTPTQAFVVTLALARRKARLNQEVAEKIKDSDPSFGLALKAILMGEERECARGLQVLLRGEVDEPAPGWLDFWLAIRTSVLEGLATREFGPIVLCRCLPQLKDGGATRRKELLSSSLAEVYLTSLDLLTFQERSCFLELLFELALEDSKVLSLLESRLLLSTYPVERPFLGEVLRRIYEEVGRNGDLSCLRANFTRDVLTVGSTAGSLALVDLLNTWGEKVLEEASLYELEGCSRRQALNVITMWGHLLERNPELAEPVAKLFVRAFSHAPTHWGILLKSPLLQNLEVEQALGVWLSTCTAKTWRALMDTGQSWPLAAVHRRKVADLLGRWEHGLYERWYQEWTKVSLNFQSLGWIALCQAKEAKVIDPWIEERLFSMLKKRERNPYFWDLISTLARSYQLSMEVREAIWSTARQLVIEGRVNVEEEFQLLLEASVTAITSWVAPDRVVLEEAWCHDIAEGSHEVIEWTLRFLKELYLAQPLGVSPSQRLLSSLLKRMCWTPANRLHHALEQALQGDAPHGLGPKPLTFDLKNLGLEVLAACAWASSCPPAMREALECRLVSFLIAWGQDFSKAEDTYAFRTTPLFSLLESLSQNPPPYLFALLDEVSDVFLALYQEHPRRLPLDRERSCRQFFINLQQYLEPRLPGEALVWAKIFAERPSTF